MSDSSGIHDIGWGAERAERERPINVIHASEWFGDFKNPEWHAIVRLVNLTVKLLHHPLRLG